MSLLLTTGLCQQQPVVVPNPIAANQQFTVTCEANRFPLVPSSVTNINALILSRNLSTGNAVVASYVAFNPPGSNDNLTKSTIPLGRNWTISFNGNTDASGSITGNRNTMRIVLVVWDARCEDAGIYRCHVDYYPPGSSIISSTDNTVNVTATAGMGQIELSVIPLPDYNTNQYNPGDNITFTCTVRGQSTLKISWKLYVLEQLNNIQSDAVESPTTVTPIGTGSCAENTIQGTLSLQLRDINKEEAYACVVTDSSNNNKELGMVTTNITIASAQPQTGPSKAASPDVGMIVGIVIGCVVLIAIIIIVIFFVLRRKRSKEGGNYKSNSDQADANRNTDLHAPPPVFHSTSKSNKGFKEEKEVSKISTGMTNEALDNSYDSRDSGLKGPPRYINAEADAQGPPRYEKESHRGRSNKGYDEDKEKNGGHGRSHRQSRDGEDRKHRSRGYDDDSNHHHRRYNPDDGTVTVGPTEYGDPDMGTSI